MNLLGAIARLLSRRQLPEIVRDQYPRLGATNQHRTQNGSPRFYIAEASRGFPADLRERPLLSRRSTPPEMVEFISWS